MVEGEKNNQDRKHCSINYGSLRTDLFIIYSALWLDENWGGTHELTGGTDRCSINLVNACFMIKTGWLETWESMLVSYTEYIQCDAHTSVDYYVLNLDDVDG
jgi:hypothetical protein